MVDFLRFPLAVPKPKLKKGKAVLQGAAFLFWGERFNIV
jgi:hypothetical protein